MLNAGAGLSLPFVAKNNLSATSAPSATDDSTAEYSAGSVWLDTTNDQVYFCLDATASAAIWIVTSTKILVNAQTGTSYTLVLADASKLVTMTNASANTLTIPTNAAVAFPIGTRLEVVMNGAGTTTIAGDTGVTVNGVSGGSGDINTQYQGVVLTKTGTNTWLASGDIGTVA